MIIYSFLHNNISHNLMFLEVSWPQGKYTLVKPNSGCPPGWAEGWRHQDNEDSDNKNALSSGHHFSGNCLIIY